MRRIETERMRPVVTAALFGLDPISVENPARPGTPDINYVGGWLELKYLEAWPARPETPVVIPHYTEGQRVWALRRLRCGGHVHMLLKVEQSWTLIPSYWSAIMVGKAPKKALLEKATRHWPKGLNAEELRAVLTNLDEPYFPKNLIPGSDCEYSVYAPEKTKLRRLRR